MDNIHNDILTLISLYLNPQDIINLCASSKHLYSFQCLLLKNREEELQSKISLSLWCRVCNSKISKGLHHILVVCDCRGYTYPYYHTHCIQHNFFNKIVSVSYCPLCLKFRTIVKCTYYP
mgnify:CR=1 FL=1|uniref:Uncharacterized protein n=1 Tax=viral metagenome TaxID=1070528 RepID=A0A6C0F940_9ZZZZ